MEEVNKLLNDYISNHNKNFDFYFIDCEFVIEFNNNFIAILETKYFHNTDFFKKIDMIYMIMIVLN